MNNIFQNIPQDLPQELFETLLESKNVKIEKIVSQGHSSPNSGWYNQELNEWVIVLEGEAILEFYDKEDVKLCKGDYLNIPSHTKHKVKWTHPKEKTIWLALFYKD